MNQWKDYEINFITSHFDDVQKDLFEEIESEEDDIKDNIINCNTIHDTQISGSGTTSSRNRGYTSYPYVFTTSASTFKTETEVQLENINNRLKRIEDALMILPSISDDDHKQLREAYDRFRAIEKLVGGRESSDDG